MHTDRLWDRPLDPMPERIVVTVSVPPDTTHPDLAADIRDAIAGRENGVAVEVRFVETQHAPAVTDHPASASWTSTRSLAAFEIDEVADTEAATSPRQFSS